MEQQNILIVTDKNIISAGLLDLMKKELPKDVKVMVIDTVPVEPTFSYINSVKSRISSFKPDLIIGLGGGSCMDCAKVCFVSYERPDIDILEITPLVNLNLRKKAKLILIPTTSGTGSECSWAAVISDDDHRRKNELASPEIIADYAILDPSLIVKMPKNLRKSTAVDALTHAVEAHSSNWRNKYSDIFSEKAVELISRNLPEVLDGTTNSEQLMNIHLGASMAGLSFSNSQITLAHSLGHSLGSHFNISHGISVGLFLPHIVKFNYKEAEDDYKILNSKFPSSIRRNKLHLTIINFFKIIDMPLRVSDLGIDLNEYESKMDSMVKLANESTGTVLNPRDTDRYDIEQLFRGVE
jgi:alcohol dehydrogenase class IV